QICDRRPVFDFTCRRRDVAPTVDGETDFPVVPSNRIEIAALIEIVDGVTRAGRLLSLEVGQEVVAIEMYLEILIAGAEALCHFLLDVGDAGRCTEGWEQSIKEMISLYTVPGLITPGQRTSIGIRKPPSHVVPFSLRNGVMAPSGHSAISAPLSVVYRTI